MNTHCSLLHINSAIHLKFRDNFLNMPNSLSCLLPFQLYAMFNDRKNREPNVAYVFFSTILFNTEKSVSPEKDLVRSLSDRLSLMCTQTYLFHSA